MKITIVLAGFKFMSIALRRYPTEPLIELRPIEVVLLVASIFFALVGGDIFMETPTRTQLFCLGSSIEESNNCIFQLPLSDSVFNLPPASPTSIQKLDAE